MTTNAASSELREESSDPLTSVGKEWPSARLKHLVQINPDSISGDEPDDWEIQYVDISSVNSRGEIEETDSMPFEEAPSRAQRLVRDGDTIVSTVRTYLKAIAHVENPPPNMVVSTGFAVLRPSDELVPRFVWRTLQAKPFVDWIVANSEGVSYPAIAPQRLGELVIPRPPIEEQQAVADFLNRRTARIDALVSKQKRLLDLLSEKRQAFITQAVTKGLDSTVATKETETEWLEEIPEHWTVSRLKYLRDSFVPIVYGIILPGPNQDKGVPIIKGGDCETGELDPESLSKTTPEKAAEYQRSRLGAGDLVYEIRGSVGRVVKVPPELEGANLTQDTARIAPSEDTDGDWLLYALRSEVFRQQMDLHMRGATVQGVNLFDLRRGVLPVPPLEEQRQIARRLEENDEKFNKLHTQTKRSIELLKEKRQALITAAVTGQIDVTEGRGEIQEGSV